MDIKEWNEKTIFPQKINLNRFIVNDFIRRQETFELYAYGAYWYLILGKIIKDKPILKDFLEKTKTTEIVKDEKLNLGKLKLLIYTKIIRKEENYTNSYLYYILTFNPRPYISIEEDFQEKLIILSQKGKLILKTKSETSFFVFGKILENLSIDKISNTGLPFLFDGNNKYTGIPDGGMFLFLESYRNSISFKLYISNNKQEITKRETKINESKIEIQERESIPLINNPLELEKYIIDQNIKINTNSFKIFKEQRSQLFWKLDELLDPKEEEGKKIVNDAILIFKKILQKKTQRGDCVLKDTSEITTFEIIDFPEIKKLTKPIIKIFYDVKQPITEKKDMNIAIIIHLKFEEKVLTYLYRTSYDYVKKIFPKPVDPLWEDIKEERLMPLLFYVDLVISGFYDLASFYLVSSTYYEMLKSLNLDGYIQEIYSNYYDHVGTL